jgi:hypothetical protein
VTTSLKSKGLSSAAQLPTQAGFECGSAAVSRAMSRAEALAFAMCLMNGLEWGTGGESYLLALLLVTCLRLLLIVILG